MAIKADYVVKETATNLSRNITLTLATIVTVAISLALVGAALLLSRGVENATARWKGDVEFIVYMKPDAAQAQIDAVQSDLDESPQISGSTYLDHDAAFSEFRELFQDTPEFLDSVETAEQIPTSFKVVPQDANADVVRSLAAQFRTKAGVYDVAAATDTIKTMQRISGIISTGIFIGALVLGTAALVLITNTIRTAMFARRREIEVMKLVGATNWFIRIPFMLEGLIQGLVGAGFGVGAVFLLNYFFEDRLAGADGFDLLQSFVVNNSDVIGTSLLIVVAGSAIGVIGSGIAVSRFLDV